MDKETAIAVWTQLERLEFHQDPDEEDTEDQGWDLPAFSVRLDARITNDWAEARDYRVRVVATDQGESPLGPEWYRDVLDQASQAGVEVSIQNNGIELS